MRRNRLLLSFVVALVLMLDSAASAQQLEKIVIGHSSLRNDIAFLWVSQQLGFFKKMVSTRLSYLFLGECG